MKINLSKAKLFYKMRKLILVVLCCAANISLAWSQSTGSVSGRVQAGNTPLSFANVQVAGTNLGTHADEEGRFTLEQIPIGVQNLSISQVGYQQFTKLVEIQPGQTTKLNIQLTEDRLNLEEVVVSGTRYALSRKESPVVVNVLSPRMLNATQSMAISEGLNYQPGVRMETNCQNCGFTQVRLNGLEGAYSQILINGRPVFSALNSVYGLEQIPTNIVERIEVVRSGGSALYGSNAIAGTVNIITRDPIENTWQVGSNFALIDGSTPDNTVNFNGSLVSEDLMSGVTFYGMFRDRDSFDANEDGFTEITLLENNTFGTKAFFKPNERSKITLDFNAIQEYRRGGDRLELAPHLTDITEELDHNTIFSGLTYDLFSQDSRNKFSAYVSSQVTQRDSYYGGLGGGRTAADSLLAINAYGQTEDFALVSGLQFTRTFSSSNTITLGVENQYNDVQDRITGYNKLVDQQVNALGFYGQFEWNVTDRLKTLMGARYDQTAVDGLYEIETITRRSDSNFGVFSPRMTLLYDINDQLQFRGGYARGFRAPQAFNEDLHISSVGGEPQFVILSESLEKELSDAFTASFNYTQTYGNTQTNLLIEGFYTDLQNPFTIISTGATLPNGSIVEEVRNGEGAVVSGINFEFSAAPSSELSIQMGGTAQRAEYKSAQVLFEPEVPTEDESAVVVNEFVRNPNFYGYLATGWQASDNLDINLTGTYTGPMIVPRVVSESGFLELRESPTFLDANIKLAYHFELSDAFHLEFNGGVQNVFDAFQDDFDSGPTRDSDYVYGPFRPRTFFFGIKIGDFH